MNSNLVAHRAAAGAAFFLFAALAASSCVSEPSGGPTEGPSAASEAALDGDSRPPADPPDPLWGQCPWGWFELYGGYFQCDRNERRETAYINGRVCVRCVPTFDEDCDYPWVTRDAFLSCERGDRLIYRGACKRCEDDDSNGYEDECESDSDCMTTGCSNELCSVEEDVSTCEWRDEYVCYSRPFAHCGCQDGACDWERNSRLERCLERHGGDEP